MDYKYHSKKYALRQKIRWRLELWGALRIMGVTALQMRILQSCAERSSAAPKRGLASLAGHTLL